MMRAANLRLGWLSMGLVVVVLAACEGDGGAAVGDEDVAGDTTGDGGDGEVAGAGLGIDYGEGGVMIRYEPEVREFTATPWPTDRLRVDGRVDLTTFPNRGQKQIIERYKLYGQEVLDGFGRNSSIYFQISGPIDMASLPTAAESMSDARAVVQLVDLTAESPRHGARLPLVFSQVDGQEDPFYLGPTLAMRAVFGFPLADASTYCAIVTRAVRGSDGAYLADNPAFVSALADEPSLAPLRGWLDGGGAALAASDVAAATCFTTQDATREMRELERFIAARPTAAPDTLVYTGQNQHFREITGMYTTPNFQSGDKPYRDEGGDVRFDDSGDPIVAEDERVRFRLLIPRQHEMPEAGWPLIIYSHGTFGDWKTCIDGNEAQAVREGLAMICVDQPLHGTRGVSEEVNYLDVFNFLNPRSGRMTFRQSAADAMWLSRMVVDGRFDFAAGATALGERIAMDPNNIVFFGHSHGGLAGAIVLAVDARIKGAVLSGASGVMIETILRRKDPLDIAGTLAVVLSVKSDALDTFHPALTLAQTLVDATDPINYAPYWLEPVTGGNSKHVFMTEGTEDALSPAVGADAVAAAAGIPLLNPVAVASEAHALKGLEPVSMPVNSNLRATTGQLITGAIRQFEGGDHWVALTDPVAIQIWRGFFRAFRQKDIPTIQR